MRWKLVVIEGGAEETTEYYLDRFPVTIGRKRDNVITIDDELVSRYHCRIVRPGAGLRLADAGSVNGVKVNGETVSSIDLAAGDEIEIGPLRMRLEQTAEKPAEPGPEPGDPPPVLPPDSIEFRPTSTDHLLLRSDPARAAADLRMLLDLCRDVSTEQSPEAVQRRLLSALFEAAPAERGAVVLVEPGSRLETAVGLHRVRGDYDVPVSGTTLAKVVGEGRAFLRNRIQSDPADVPESLVAAEAQAALAAPLTSRGETIGAVYLDTTRADQPFDERHLNVATAAAAVCAPVIEAALREERMRRGARALREQAGRDGFPEAFDPLMRAATRLMEEAAQDGSPALIVGPPGTGRRRAAEAIHDNGSAADGPFVAFNCAGRDEATTEAELWGAAGALRNAAGGTLYLREVGALPQTAQARLVSLLEEERLPARLIASSSADLRRAVADGDFHEALLHRLEAHRIELPSLRDRGEGVVGLANAIARRASAAHGRRWRGFSQDAEIALRLYRWPGNVRELANAVERAERLREGETIEIEDLPDSVVEAVAAAESLHDRVTEAKRTIIREALDRCGGSVSQAAEDLGVNRTYLHRLITQLGVREDSD